MEPRNIIVIGASAGGFEALKTIVRDLPVDLPATIFVVWHMSPDVTGVLPEALNKAGRLPAKNAVDGEVFESSKIYVAPPDRHLLIDRDELRVTRGPKENRFRPAVDPLFRSAAFAYGARVIGVILSGALDDGTSGLWTIKHRGGLAIVQDPADAEIPSMPRSAIREVAVDYVVPVSEMAELLVRLSRETPSIADETAEESLMENDRDQTEFEIRTAAEEKTTFEIMKFGELTQFTCPECHGVLFRLKDGSRPRFRCHTGHAFSSDSLLTSVTESIEENIWSAIRCIDESAMLLNQLGEHFAENEQTNLAAVYFKKAFEARDRGETLRETVMNHERLSADSVREQAGALNGSERETADESIKD